MSELLTLRCGLGDRVAVVQGNALSLPFPDASFDVAWTQHASMNVADKRRFLAELRRVLADRGRLALFDIVAGETGPPHYPVPWADDERLSFLATADEVRRLVREAGFEEVVWEDATAEASAFFERVLSSATAAAPAPLGLHVIVPDAGTKFANQVRNVAEGRIRLLRAVCRAV